MIRTSCKLLAASIAVALLTPGCATLKRNPVPENVVISRQLSHRGIEAMQRGNWDEAEMLFARAIENSPTDERAQHRYAQTLWQRGAWQEAIRHMEQAVSLSGTDADLLVELGEMYLARGEIALAGQRAQQAITRRSTMAPAWKLRGDVLRRRGQFDDAMQSYHRALSLQPDYSATQLALSEMYLDQQRPRRALSTLDSLASRYLPDEVPQEVLVMRGAALKDLSRYHDAATVLAQAAERGNLTVDLLYQLAEAQWLAGNAASAQVAAQSALARAPSDTRAQALLARIRDEVVR